MRCASCQVPFRWTDVPLVCPCRGFHTAWKYKCLPLARWCQHRDKPFHVTTANRAAYYAQNVSVLALPVTLAAPALAVGALVVAPHALVVRPLHEAYKGWVRRSKMRARRKAIVIRTAKFLHDDEQTLRRSLRCRRGEVPHSLVAGWCQDCGLVAPGMSGA